MNQFLSGLAHSARAVSTPRRPMSPVTYSSSGSPPLQHRHSSPEHLVQEPWGTWSTTLNSQCSHLSFPHCPFLSAIRCSHPKGERQQIALAADLAKTDGNFDLKINKFYASSYLGVDVWAYIINVHLKCVNFFPYKLSSSKVDLRKEQAGFISIVLGRYL